MPIVEFRCPQCGTTFEHLVLGSARREDVECVKCGARKLETMMSAPSLRPSGSVGGSSQSSSGCGGGRSGFG